MTFYSPMANLAYKTVNISERLKKLLALKNITIEQAQDVLSKIADNAVKVDDYKLPNIPYSIEKLIEVKQNNALDSYLNIFDKYYTSSINRDSFDKFIKKSLDYIEKVQKITGNNEAKYLTREESITSFSKCKEEFLSLINQPSLALNIKECREELDKEFASKKEYYSLRQDKILATLKSRSDKLKQIIEDNLPLITENLTIDEAKNLEMQYENLCKMIGETHREDIALVRNKFLELEDEKDKALADCEKGYQDLLENFYQVQQLNKDRDAAKQKFDDLVTINLFIANLCLVDGSITEFSVESFLRILEVDKLDTSYDLLLALGADGL